jgi:hypothetical protein
MSDEIEDGRYNVMVDSEEFGMGDGIIFRVGNRNEKKCDCE